VKTEKMELITKDDLKPSCEGFAILRLTTTNSSNQKSSFEGL
jgi:hypothetical protein